MQIAVGKSYVLHLGSNNTKHTYVIDNISIPTTQSMRDLGVTVDSKLTFSDHITSMVSRASSRAIIIRRSFRHKDLQFQLQLYKTFIRPMLEFASSVWSPSPNNVQHFKKIEAVQRRFTKYLPGLFNLSYKERLTVLNLLPLAHRRIFSDLILFYKIIKNRTGLTKDNLDLTFAHSHRRHSLHILTKGSTKEIRHNSYSVRTIRLWNCLSEETVSAQTVNCFRQRLVLDTGLSQYLSRVDDVIYRHT